MRVRIKGRMGDSVEGTMKLFILFEEGIRIDGTEEGRIEDRVEVRVEGRRDGRVEG